MESEKIIETRISLLIMDIEIQMKESVKSLNIGENRFNIKFKNGGGISSPYKKS